jgi:hypothetical protein
VWMGGEEKVEELGQLKIVARSRTRCKRMHSDPLERRICVVTAARGELPHAPCEKRQSGAFGLRGVPRRGTAPRTGTARHASHRPPEIRPRLPRRCEACGLLCCVWSRPAPLLHLTLNRLAHDRPEPILRGRGASERGRRPHPCIAKELC